MAAADALRRMPEGGEVEIRQWLGNAAKKMVDAKKPHAEEEAVRLAEAAARSVFSRLDPVRHPMPTLMEAFNKEGARARASSVSPALGTSRSVRQMLDSAAAAGGPQGRRLAGAALRGMHKAAQHGEADQWPSYAATEVASVTAKDKGFAKRATVLEGAGLFGSASNFGNAIDVISVVTAVTELIASLRDEDASTARRLANIFYLVLSVASYFT